MTGVRRAVFLSYASQDCGVAELLSDALRKVGIEVWFDKSALRGGDAWDKRIRDQIRDCALFIPIISSNTQARAEGYFRLEWKLAVDRSYLMADDEPFLLPVTVDQDLDQRARVPERFRQVQWTPFQIQSLSTFANHISDLLTNAHRNSSTQVAPRTSEFPRITSTSRRFHFASGLVAVALAACLIYLVVEKFALVRVPVKSAHEITHSPNATPAIPAKSVAVLPFVDMSENHDQEYFADGLTEELIDRLSQSPDLKVIARTSSFHYKARNDDVRKIANALGVRHLLEGSVRKSGRQLRITVQLLLASDGSHIWSETYDQLAKDVFRIQTDIANTVTRKLNATLTTSDQGDDSQRAKFSAYEQVLQGDSHRAFTKNDIDARIANYRLATELDAGYALAWARLAMSLHWKTQFVQFQEATELDRQSLDLARHALNIDPNLAYGHLVIGTVTLFRGDYALSEEELRRANLLEPGIADRFLAEAAVRRTGDLLPAIDTYRKLLDRDPKYPTLYSRLGDFLFHAGQFDESENVLRQLIAMEPNFVGARLQLIQTLVFQGSAKSALSEIDRETVPENVLWEKALVFWALGRRDEANAILVGFPRDPDNYYDLAQERAFRGEVDEAFRDLNSAVDEAPMSATEIRYDRFFNTVRHDPRFGAVLNKLSETAQK